MTKQKNTAFKRLSFLTSNTLYKVGALVWSMLFFALAINVYYSDSEIWLLTVSQNLLHPSILPSLYYKYSFHALTYFFSHWAPSELAVYTWARIGWALIGLVSVGWLAQLFTNVYKRPDWLWPLFIFLITSSLYLNQGFRIRGDVFCLFLHVLYLKIFFEAYSQGIKKYTSFQLLALVCIMTLATPKFILFLICQIGLCLSWSQSSSQKKSLVWLVISSTLIPVALGCAVALILSYFGHKELLVAVSLAGDFYLKTSDPQLANPLLFSITDFYHFFKFFSMSHTHSLLLVVWLLAFFIFIFKKSPSLNPLTQPLQIYAGLLLFFVLIYNQKLPFFLGPFLAPVLAQAFCFLFNTLSFAKPKKSSFVLAFLILASSVNGGINFFKNMFYNSNYFQSKVIRQLDEYTARHPELKIYDIIGILPRKNNMFVFVGPSEGTNKQSMIEEILTENPDMILIVYKFQYLEPEFPPLLQKNWVPVDKDVWVKGRFISPVENQKLFLTSVRLKEKDYWVIPYPQEKYILDIPSHKSLQNEIFPLDFNMRVTEGQPAFLALPKSSAAFVLTDVEPLTLKYSPSTLFRYDTGF